MTAQQRWWTHTTPIRDSRRLCIQFSREDFGKTRLGGDVLHTRVDCALSGIMAGSWHGQIIAIAQTTDGHSTTTHGQSSGHRRTLHGNIRPRCGQSRKSVGAWTVRLFCGHSKTGQTNRLHAKPSRLRTHRPFLTHAPLRRRPFMPLPTCFVPLRVQERPVSALEISGSVSARCRNAPRSVP